MGSRRLDSFSDLARHGYDLRVTCRGCERVRVLDARELSIACTASRRSRNIEKVVDRLKCRICGCRNVEWIPVARE